MYLNTHCINVSPPWCAIHHIQSDNNIWIYWKISCCPSLCSTVMKDYTPRIMSNTGLCASCLCAAWRHFAGRWVGRGGPNKWKACDKSLFYSTFLSFCDGQWRSLTSKARKRYELEQQIRQSFAARPLEFIRKNFEFVYSRLQKCLQNVGAHAGIFNHTEVRGL